MWSTRSYEIFSVSDIMFYPNSTILQNLDMNYVGVFGGKDLAKRFSRVEVSRNRQLKIYLSFHFQVFYTFHGVKF